jgi:hypothetical protein
MAIGPTSWSVLPHGPINVLASNLWWVEGRLNRANRRIMTLVRLGDGRIVMHNPIALDEPSMDRIDGWGEVSALLVPNRFHRRDAYIMQARYPKAKAYAPRGALAAASRATPCSGSYTDVPSDATLSLREVDGVGEREGSLLVKSDDGVTAVFCDTVLNLPKLSGWQGVILHPTGTLAVPRPTEWLFTKDKGALRSDLLRIAANDGLVRVIPGHGSIVASEAQERLREAAERLS